MATVCATWTTTDDDWFVAGTWLARNPDPPPYVSDVSAAHDVTLPGGRDSSAALHLGADLATGGIDVTVNSTACYCEGTLILTERGEVPVQDLAIGDVVVTVSGEGRPIRWIGWRSYTGRFLAGRRDMLPVCFKAGGLGLGMPRRDLFVSPKHAMYLDGYLIPAEQLVNGRSVVQADQVDRVVYYHVELDSHDLLLAEGAPSESFVDDDSRGMFHNAFEYGRLYPDHRPTPACYVAPRLDSGYEVELARRRILGRWVAKWVREDLARPPDEPRRSGKLPDTPSPE